MLKLISEQFQICYASRAHHNELSQSKSSTVFEPDGQFLALGFGCLLGVDQFPRDFIQGLIDRGFGVVYFCDKIPSNAIINLSIVYIVADWAWFTHTAFVDYYRFSLVFHSGPGTIKVASKFRKLSYTDCPGIDPTSKGLKDAEIILKNLDPALREDKSPKTLLFDSVSHCGDRGLGDILMTTIPLRHLAEQGWRIDYVVRRGAAKILEGNPYINKIWETPHEIGLLQKDDLRSVPKVANYRWYFTLATNLEEYRIPRNLNCRIDSICDLLRINVKDIQDFTPVLKLTEEEQEYGKQYRKEGKLNIVLGLTSNGSDSRSYPNEYYEALLEQLNDSGQYNIIVTDQAPLNILEGKNLVNLTGKLTLRQWASVVYNSDLVVSMDTGIYWIGLSFNKPCIVMFTTIEPDLRIAHHKHLCTSIYPPLECKPCFDKQMIRDMDAWKTCIEHIRKGNPTPCTKALTPSKIIRAIKEFSIHRTTECQNGGYDGSNSFC